MKLSVTDNPTRKEMREVKRLYRRAFPKSERKPFSMILKLRKAGKCDILHFSEDSGFRGLAITVKGDGLVLVDYFAVAEGKRGVGIGGEMMRMLLSRYTGMGVFLEIEEPKGDGGVTDRRLSFYERAGFRDLSVSVKLFGVDMILLGVDCTLGFESYRAFYCDNIGRFAYNHIKKI